MPFPARYPGQCASCGKPINRGDMITWSRKQRGRVWHATCPDADGRNAAAVTVTQGDTQSKQAQGSTQDDAELGDGKIEFTDDDQTSGSKKQTESEAPTPGSIDAIVEERISKRLQGFEPKDAMDRKKVREIVRDAVKDACAPVSVTIEVKRLDESTAEVKDAHYLMPRLLRLLGAGFYLYLWGPPGSGKTTAALQAADALGMGAEIDTLDPSTFKSTIMGYRTPNGEPVATQFSRCWTGGKVYVADECDNGPANVQTLFNSALANHHAPLAWGSILKAEGFGFVGTGNTPGRPTAAFPDRKPMSAAFADRLYFIHWPLDEAIECRAAGLRVPPRPEPALATCTAAEWATFVQTMRKWAVDNAPTLMVTPRATLLGLKALALGESPVDVAHALIFRGADSSLVSKALAAVKLP